MILEWGGGVTLHQFKINDLFIIKPTKNYGLSNNELMKISGSNPVVSNTSLNNGITGYINREPTENGNIITFSDTTTDDAIFYQPNSFVGYSHIQGMYPVTDKNKWNKKNYLYFVSAFKKAVCGKYSYGIKFNRDRASKEMVWLPIKNGKPDYEKMNKYIYVIEKLIIKNVIEWKNHKLNILSKIE